MKQELLDYLNAELNTYKNLDKNTDVNVHEFCKDRSALITNLISATEQAIFDVPSEEEILSEVKSKKLNANQTLNFCKGINFIVNYKPTL